jgi:hypothetical protein
MSHEAKPLHYRDVSKETPCTGCPDCDGTRHAVAGHGCVSMAEPLNCLLCEGGTEHTHLLPGYKTAEPLEPEELILVSGWRGVINNATTGATEDSPDEAKAEPLEPGEALVPTHEAREVDELKERNLQLHKANFQQAAKINEIQGMRNEFARKLMEIFKVYPPSEEADNFDILDAVRQLKARAESAEMELKAKPLDVCNYDAPMTHHGQTSTLGMRDKDAK